MGRNTLLRHTISAGGYITVNKQLARRLSLHAAIVLGELVWQSERHDENDTLDSQGYFQVYRAELEKATTLSPKLQRAAEKLLDAHKLIKTKLNKDKNAVWYKLSDSDIEKLLRDAA